MKQNVCICHGSGSSPQLYAWDLRIRLSCPGAHLPTDSSTKQLLMTENTWVMLSKPAYAPPVSRTHCHKASSTEWLMYER